MTTLFDILESINARNYLQLYELRSQQRVVTCYSRLQSHGETIAVVETRIPGDVSQLFTELQGQFASPEISIISVIMSCCGRRAAVIRHCSTLQPPIYQRLVNVNRFEEHKCRRSSQRGVRSHWRRLGASFGGRGRRVSAEIFFCRPQKIRNLGGGRRRTHCLLETNVGSVLSCIMVI